METIFKSLDDLHQELESVSGDTSINHLPEVQYIDFEDLPDLVLE